MGKLIKNHLARLMTLTAATYEAWAGLMGIFWPKLFWDIFTFNLNFLVKPFPYLQIANIVLGLLILAFEWPLGFLASWKLHASFELRFLLYPLAAWASALQYQATNAAFAHLIALFIWVWAYCDGEMIQSVPWKLPPRPKPKPRAAVDVKA